LCMNSNSNPTKDNKGKPFFHLAKISGNPYNFNARNSHSSQNTEQSAAYSAQRLVLSQKAPCFALQ